MQKIYFYVVNAVETILRLETIQGQELFAEIQYLTYKCNNTHQKIAIILVGSLDHGRSSF